MHTQKLTVVNPTGLHARPAAEFCKIDPAAHPGRWCPEIGWQRRIPYRLPAFPFVFP